MRTSSISLAILTLFVCIYGVKAQEQRGSVVAKLDVLGPEHIAWSADSSKVAVSTAEQIFVWETQNWRLLYTIPNAFSHTIAWHPTESKLAGLQTPGEERLMIWDGDTGELVQEIVREIPEGFPRYVITLNVLSWNPQGSLITSDSIADTIVIWDVEAETSAALVPLGEPPWHNVTEMSWNNTGEFLLSGGVDGTICVWDAQTGENFLTVEGYKYVSWNPEGTHFAGGGFDTNVNIWSLETGEIETQFLEHTNTITSIDWNTDGKTLASTDADGNLFLWNFPTGNQFRLDFVEGMNVNDARWSPDGLRLAIVTIDSVIVTMW